VTLVVLCSGQGHQHSGMFTLTGGSPEASDLFAIAASLLGDVDPRTLVRDRPLEYLQQNRCGQILCTLQALAASAALQDIFPSQTVIAGYSVGEVAAWGVAGAFSARDTLQLVSTRADLMNAANFATQGMLFIRGVARNVVDQLCEANHCAIAIINPGEGFVIGGTTSDLNTIAGEARARKAQRIVFLPVRVASHTPLLHAATPLFREALNQVPSSIPAPTGYRMLSGVDGEAVFNRQEGLDKLANQISHTVRWAECLERCVEHAPRAVIELGPGNALSEMVAGAYPRIPTRSIDDFRTLTGVRDWLKNHLNA